MDFNLVFDLLKDTNVISTVKVCLPAIHRFTLSHGERGWGEGELTAFAG